MLAAIRTKFIEAAASSASLMDKVSVLLQADEDWLCESICTDLDALKSLGFKCPLPDEHMSLVRELPCVVRLAVRLLMLFCIVESDAVLFGCLNACWVGMLFRSLDF